MLLKCMYVYRFQNVFLRCPTPRLHRFLSSHWPSFRFLSYMAFIPSIQFFFSLPHILLCFGIHFHTILGNLPFAIRWTWPYHVSWFCSSCFIMVEMYSNKIVLQWSWTSNLQVLVIFYIFKMLLYNDSIICFWLQIVIKMIV